MAFSSSIKRAQALKLCELCDENSLKWRCVDCDMCLCEKCKNFHLKVPATARHQIVTIGTPLEQIQRKIMTDNITCSIHSDKMAVLFCQSCKFMICTECVTSSHKTHNMIQTESAIDEKLDYFREIQDQIGNNFKTCNSKTLEVQDLKTKCNVICDKSLTNIKQKEQELVDAIKKQSELLQNEVEMNRKQIIKALTKIDQDVDNTKKYLKKEKDKTDAILTSNQGKDILGTIIKIEDLKFDSLPNQFKQFIPDKESTKKIPELFGSFQKFIMPPTDIRLDIIKSFTTDLLHISKVLTLDQESAWISCFPYNISRKIQIKDNNMTTSQELSLLVCDMAITSNGDILLTEFNKSDVKLLEKSGEIVFFTSLAPLFPFGIHVTKDNDVIVSVMEPGYLYTPTDQSQRVIVVYGMNGIPKHKYQYDKDSKRLFTNAFRFTTNNNQDILVIDATSSNTGRVVVLNKKGELRWLYEGHDRINTNTQFDPRGIVTTAAGLIIVSDIRSHAVHILSENGEVLSCKVLKDIGIMWPWGLDIDEKGRLWIGCHSGGTTGAKLHLLNLTN